MAGSPRDRREAERLYQEFHAFEPKSVGTFHGSFRIPSTVACVGEAVHIMYRSDKWERKAHNYIHEHEAGVRVYVPGRGTEVPVWLREARTLVRLGDCLGFAFEDDEGLVEGKVSKPYPELYTTPDGKALLVVEGKRKLVAMMWGGMLDVTPRGIVG